MRCASEFVAAWRAAASRRLRGTPLIDIRVASRGGAPRFIFTVIFRYFQFTSRLILHICVQIHRNFNFNPRVMIIFTRKIRIWYFAIYFSMKISSYRIICDSLPCYSFSRDSPRTIRTTVIREIVDVNTLNIDIFIPRTAHLLKRENIFIIFLKIAITHTCIRYSRRGNLFKYSN